MSTYESHLNESKYGYDMVVAVTQRAVDATIKQFLQNFEGKEFIACYQLNPDPNDNKKLYLPMDLDKVVAIAEMDPFSIPDTRDQDPAQRAAVTRLYDALFAFAFKAKMGIPEGFPISKIPSTIILNKVGAEVTYNLYFQNMTILNIQEQRPYKWQNLSQSYDDESSVPWVFQFRVSLDFSTNNSVFANLPKSVQDKVKNLNPDSAFSVQQLYLDLNTALLTSNPAIIGLDPDGPAAYYLSKIFINNYYEQLKSGSVSPTNPNGYFLLGYGILPTKPSTTNPSIIPTDLTISVSPFYDDSRTLHVSDQFENYTLNYLVMTRGATMPPPYPFVWNWLDSSQVRDYHGAMSIRKEVFTQFLLDLLSPSLKNICLVPIPYIHVNAISAEWSLDFKKTTDPQRYKPVTDPLSNTKVLTFFYTAYAEAKDDWGKFITWGNISATVTVQSDIYLENNLIKTDTTGTVNCHINIEGGVTAGNFVKYNTKTSYEIGVDQNGNLKAKMAPGSPAFTDQSDQINPNGWSKFVTFGEINGVIDGLRKDMESMKEFLKGFDRQIEQMLNGSGVWVFPGGKTFVFKDVHFSNFQDLTAHLTYVEPT